MRTTLKYALFMALVGGAAIVAAACINVLRLGSRQIIVAPILPQPVAERRAAEHLGGAVRFQTISHDLAQDLDRGEFVRLHAFLQQMFPHAHAILTREVINGYSLLYTWHGEDAAQRPVVLMAHQDVVPIAWRRSNSPRPRRPDTRLCPIREPRSVLWRRHWTGSSTRPTQQ